MSAKTEVELAIRAARAEIERDAAIKRAEFAEDMVRVHQRNDPEELLDKLHLMGIPAREVKELFEAEMLHHRSERLTEALEAIAGMANTTGIRVAKDRARSVLKKEAK